MKIKAVIYKKIPRKEKAVGLAWHDRRNDPARKVGTIEIDPRQTPLNMLDTEIHECIHMHYPEIPEESVERMARRISKFVYRLGYRKH